MFAGGYVKMLFVRILLGVFFVACLYGLLLYPRNHLPEPKQLAKLIIATAVSVLLFVATFVFF